MNIKLYEKEINSIILHNPVELELYSLVANIIRERDNYCKILLRDVSNRRRAKTGNSCYYYGCIEIKYLNKDLDNENYIEQLKGHIKVFNKVIYTNGAVWRYYYKSNVKRWEIKLFDYDLNKKIVIDSNKWKELMIKLNNIKYY